jgi:hypothetical protein
MNQLRGVLVDPKNPMDVEDRATMLKALAERWDDLICTFDDGRNPAPNGYLTCDLFLAAARHYAHSNLTDLRVADYMESLRDALAVLRNYEVGTMWPDNLDQDIWWLRSHEDIMNKLAEDVDLAIAPLLFGTVSFCWQCTRTRGDVTSWQLPEKDSVHCAAHKPVVFGRSDPSIAEGARLAARALAGLE